MGGMEDYLTVRVSPTPAALMDSTAALTRASCWKAFTRSCRLLARTDPSMKMCFTFFLQCS